jgi:hypothetical protein
MVRARVLVLLALGACRGGCVRMEQTHDVALGWKGPVESWPYACKPMAAHPAHVVATSTTDYDAVAVGTEDFDCADLVVHVRVAPIARLDCDLPPTIFVGKEVVPLVFGRDASGARLDLGSSWDRSLGGVLETAPPYDMAIISGWAVRASAPGKGELIVTFGTLTQTFTTTAVAPIDAGGA